MKTTGKEFKEFYNDDTYWKDRHVEELDLKINGVVVDDFDSHMVDDTDHIVVRDGIVLGGSTDVGVKTFFRRWLRARTTTSLVIDVDKAKLDAFKELLKDPEKLLSMRDRIKELHDELKSVLEWAVTEKVALRRQEITRITSILEKE